MDDAEFTRLGKRHRLTADEQRAWFAELDERKKEERRIRHAEKIKTKGRFRASECSTIDRRYTVTGRSGRKPGHKPD